jgi:hypothetical protein
MDINIPRYLFHITLCNQLRSIQRFGLGNDWKDVYLIDFDPRKYLDSEPNHLNEEQIDKILTIIGILLNNKYNMDIAVITIDTRYLNINRLEKDQEEYIWNYYDVIHQFKVDCFEISITEKDDDSDFEELHSIEFSEQLFECFQNSEHIYCRRINYQIESAEGASEEDEQEEGLEGSEGASEEGEEEGASEENSE